MTWLGSRISERTLLIVCAPPAPPIQIVTWLTHPLVILLLFEEPAYAPYFVQKISIWIIRPNSKRSRSIIILRFSMTQRIKYLKLFYDATIFQWLESCRSRNNGGRLKYSDWKIKCWSLAEENNSNFICLKRGPVVSCCTCKVFNTLGAVVADIM